MTKYEGLQSKFLEWNNLHNHYGDKATLAMVGFFNGFQVYLDAPDKATRLCKVNYDFPDLDKYTPVDSPGKALSQTENNAWHFGINCYPPFFLLIFCRIFPFGHQPNISFACASP